MGSLLCLFVQHKAVGIPDQRSVVCVEEHLIWKLRGDQEKQEISKCLHTLLTKRKISTIFSISKMQWFFLPFHRAWNCRSQR